MGVTYFKRFRMECDLTRDAPPFAEPGRDYLFFPWADGLLSAHAEAKYRSFREEIDAHVFPCLGEREGCRRLMREISQRPGFLAEATWLAAWQPRRASRPVFCGTVQGVRDREGVGSIQNLGVAPDHRGQRLGAGLLLRALEGFRRAGLRRAFLEVTAQNLAAIQLYERAGFRTTRTVYKAVELAAVPV